MSEIGSLLPWAGAAGAWIWTHYGKEISDSLIAKVLEKGQDKASEAAAERISSTWKKFNWERAAQTYNEEMRKQHNWTRVIGKAEPISLEGIFTDVYILDQPTAFRRFDIRVLQTDPQHLEIERTRVNGIELTQQQKSHRLYILGKPGAGKTTFLKYLALQATLGKLDKIPIFVSLKSWADSDLDLMGFLSSQFDICGFPDAKPFVEHILERGTAMVLFDGLDEVNQEVEQRGKTIAAIRDFSNKYGRSQCLITCRIAAIDYTFEQFKYVELADFTAEQIQAYVSKWFQDSPEKRARFFEEFSQEDNKRLRELGKVPLLLSLLCLSFDATLSFPQRRVEIYSEALEALLKKWDATRSIKRDDIYRGLTLGRKTQMFARIASKTFHDNEYFLNQNYLSKQIVNYLKQLPDAPKAIDIDGDAVLKAIEAQHGIFTERAARIYSFSHLTFQEYFTARHIVEDASGRALRELITLDHISDSRWREVILLTSSLLDDADLLFKLFAKALDIMIKGESDIQRILQSANLKFEEIQTEFKGAAVRAHYCAQSLALSLAFDLAHYPEFLRVYDFDRAILRAPNLDLTIVQTQVSDLIENMNRGARVDSDFYPKRGRESAILRGMKLRDAVEVVQARDQARLLALAIDDRIGKTTNDNSPDAIKLDRDLGNLLLFSVWLEALPSWRSNKTGVDKLKLYFQSVQRRAAEAGEAKVSDALSKIEKCLDRLDEPALTEFINEMRAVLKMRHLVVDDHLSKQQYINFANYLLATRLLVECLKLAVVPHRSSIEDGLLLISPLPRNSELPSMS